LLGGSPPRARHVLAATALGEPTCKRGSLSLRAFTLSVHGDGSALEAPVCPQEQEHRTEKSAYPLHQRAGHQTRNMSPFNPEHLPPGSVASSTAHQLTDLFPFSLGPKALPLPRGPPSVPPLRFHGGTEGLDREWLGSEASTREKAPYYILSRRISRLWQPQASPRPAANLSTVGLSQHAFWKVKFAV
jgi:hypothetical protein